MAIVLNDTVTSDKTMAALPLENVPETLSSSGLEELPDKIQVLPFVEDDPCGEFGWRQGCVRDCATVNRVAVECWKALRIPQTPKKPESQDLSLFPQMPIDILLEVVGHLHPIDLMHVARVNRAFRALLHAPSAEAIWRSAFIGRPPLPMCPHEISGRRWSKLLFGPRQCDECGAPDTSPDHKIWRRLCTDCMNWKLFNGVPSYSYSHEVNTLLAKTFRNDGRIGSADSDVGRLWPADGTVVAQEYERIKAADAEARLRGDDNPGALEAFIEARKLAVQAVEERAEEAEAWSDKIFSDWVEMSSVRLRRVIRSACKRLIEEGHDPRDVPSEDDALTPYLEHFPRLTSKRWNKARPHILPLVATARAARLEQERNELIVSRTTSAATAASHVLRTAPPQTWAYSPPKYTFETFAPLQALIKDPSDDPLSEDDPRLADALLGLPAFIEAWRAEKRALLASLLPPPAEAECGSSDDSAPATPNRERLDLATSVYTCLGSWVGAMSVTAGRALIGWEAAGAHLRCRSLRSYWEHRPHFAPEGAAAAAALVRLVGLDPDTATAVQMDRLCGDGSIRARKSKAPDMRFLCTLCPLEVRRGVRGRAAMRWRECVQHTIERSRMHGGDDEHRGVAPAWALLTDAAAEDVRRREALDPVVWDSAWVCALCPAHYETRVTHAAAVEHLQSDHKIREPVEGKHFIYFVGAERTPRIPALLSQEGDVAELRCNMCSHGKLRALRGIRRHVTDKHKIPAPSSADWTRVERILRTTLPPPAEAFPGPVGA